MRSGKSLERGKAAEMKRGSKNTEETKRKISRSMTGVRKSAAHRDAIRRGAYRRWAMARVRAELAKESTAARGAARSDEEKDGSASTPNIGTIHSARKWCVSRNADARAGTLRR
jgi:hypothetical protein